MRSFSGSTYLKTISLILLASGFCAIGHIACALPSPVPLNRRPTPTQPPVPSRPISVVGDESFAQIEREMRFQSNDRSRVEVAIEAAQFLSQIGATLTTSQREQLATLATTEEARVEVLNQLSSSDQ